MSADFLKSDPGRPPAARPSPGPAPPGTPGGAPGLTWGAGVKSSSASPCGFEERKGGGSWNQQPWGAPDCDPTPHASVSPFAKSTDALLHVYRRPPPPREAQAGFRCLAILLPQPSLLKFSGPASLEPPSSPPWQPLLSCILSPRPVPPPRAFPSSNDLIWKGGSPTL